MKFHFTKEEKYLFLFLILCLFTYLGVKYLGVESLKFSLKSQESKETVVFPLSLNSASFRELIQVPGIGDVLAERIINYRYEKGNFKSLDELMNVKGIGEKTFQKLKLYFKL